MQQRAKRRFWNGIIVVFAVLTLLAAALLVFELTREYRPPDNKADEFLDHFFPREQETAETNAPPVYQEMDWEVLQALPEEERPLVYITPDRSAYESGTLRLVMPRLDLDVWVGDGTEKETLDKGPALFEYAHLPGEAEENVSIAGHRIVGPNGFYNIHKLKEGDYLYLLYEGRVFRYCYESTEIVKPDAWDVIGGQGYSCLTLLSCSPARAATHRIVVRARLEEAAVWGPSYVFAEKAPD